ncbi:Uncharacterised protein [Sphingobacterium spiritivorum]|uniref:Uncharacterized protein n=1 Tax=Sphingobacterium spiritivorum TaxID=258 RepID=A0A380CMJ7_SPHSI|nr:Uncharacterised protein [Sphingobacterium spiritivorum]
MGLFGEKVSNRSLMDSVALAVNAEQVTRDRQQKSKYHKLGRGET